MIQHGMKSSMSDAGVAVHCALTALHGAHLNVRINAKGMEQDANAQAMLEKAARLSQETQTKAQEILQEVDAWLSPKQN
jgi:glutamate formiminotransferase/formiminotetrahydrofolate cyclodeaminase